MPYLTWCDRQSSTFDSIFVKLVLLRRLLRHFVKLFSIVVFVLSLAVCTGKIRPQVAYPRGEGDAVGGDAEMAPNSSQSTCLDLHNFPLGD
jgi:hypothetical protein